jgi:hypothetical protein
MKVLNGLCFSFFATATLLATPFADHHGKHYALNGVFSDSEGKKGTWTSEVHIAKTADDPRSYTFEESFKTSSGFTMEIVFTIVTKDNGFFSISDAEGGEGEGHCHRNFCQFALTGDNGTVVESWQMGDLFFAKQGFMTGSSKSVRWSGWGRSTH